MTRKGELEARIKSVCDRYVMGLIEESNMLSPYRIVQHLATEEPDAPKASVGAVSACLKRWHKIGFIDVGEKPFSFDCYTEAAEIEGLLALKKQHREKLSASKKKAVIAGDAVPSNLRRESFVASPASEPEPDPEPFPP